jgi:hypothetical protein
MRMKWEFVRVILMQETHNFGIARQGGVAPCFECTTEQRLAALVEFIEASTVYFGAAITASDVDLFIQKIIGELALEAYYSGEMPSVTLEDAVNIDNRLEMIRNLNIKKPGLVSEEQMLKYEKQTRSAIERILSEVVGLRYFEQSPDTEIPKELEKITRLTGKYNFEMPSERDVYSREVTRNIGLLESMPGNLDQIRNADFYFKNILEKKLKAESALLDIHKRLGDSILPPAISSLEDWMRTNTERICALVREKRRNVALNIAELGNGLTADLPPEANVGLDIKKGLDTLASLDGFLRKMERDKE